MSLEVTLLVLGILLLLVGLVGKVRVKEIKVGISNSIVRIIIALVGVALLVLSFNPTDRARPPERPLPKPPERSYLRGVYTIQQKSNGRYVDAHENGGNDFSVVTRPNQNNDTQKWILIPLGNNTYTIQQKSNGRYMDAWESSTYDFDVVTRPDQNNDTQKWILTPLGNDTYTILQKSIGRYMDAHENEEHDFKVVTRPDQNNNTQRWIIKAL